MTPRGFALIVSLWAIVGAGAVAMALSGTARESVGSARNRASAVRAQWMAQACAQRALAALHATLWPELRTPVSVTRAAWDSLDFAAARSRAWNGSRCAMSLSPTGLTADVNALTGDQLRRLLVSARVPAFTADSLVDALLDWRDADTLARPFGVEADWYRAQGRVPPRDAPLEATEEIAHVRGFERWPALGVLLGVSAERVLWLRAPVPVLAALPGMTAEALEVLASRPRGALADLSFLATLPEMSRAARDTLARATPELSGRTSGIPEAWVLRAAYAEGSPAIAVSVELRFTLGGGRLYLLRQVIRP
jgi:general secretion pathway protein K